MNKLEEMARAHWEAEDSGESRMERMRAAVAVLREPSEAMIGAVAGETLAPIAVRGIWQAMLDKADE